MTILVGVRCTDGVIIGADSVATSTTGHMPLIRLQSNSKISIFTNSIIVAATGAVGYSQRLSHHVTQAISGGVFSNFNANDCFANIPERLLKDLRDSMARTTPAGLEFGALMAVAIEGEPYLVEYGSTDFQPEIKKDKMFFVSMGSGQIIADPFLAFISRVLWKNTMPTLEDAKLGVFWALSHTIKLAPGGVGGDIQLATLKKVASGWVAEESQDTQEQAQYIDELESHIGRFAKEGANNGAPAIPMPPAP